MDSRSTYRIRIAARDIHHCEGQTADIYLNRKEFLIDGRCFIMIQSLLCYRVVVVRRSGAALVIRCQTGFAQGNHRTFATRVTFCSNSSVVSKAKFDPLGWHSNVKSLKAIGRSIRCLRLLTSWQHWTQMNRSTNESGYEFHLVMIRITALDV